MTLDIRTIEPSLLKAELLRLRDDLLADGRDGDIARAALENGNAEFFFKLLDGNGQRRLADEAGLGRAAEVPFTSNGNNVFKFG